MEIPAFTNDQNAGLEHLLGGIPYTLVKLAAELFSDFLQEVAIGSPFAERKSDPFLSGLFRHGSEKSYDNLHMNDFPDQVDQYKLRVR